MFRWEQGRTLHEYQALYMLRGGGEFESAAAGRRAVAPGTLMLLFPADWHRYRPDKKTGWDEYWVSFAGRHMGMSPHEFYAQLRMRRVQQLLGTDLSVKEIAHRLGFESPFHLSRAFKKRFGVPPSQWRQGR